MFGAQAKTPAEVALLKVKWRRADARTSTESASAAAPERTPAPPPPASSPRDGDKALASSSAAAAQGGGAPQAEAASGAFRRAESETQPAFGVLGLLATMNDLDGEVKRYQAPKDHAKYSFAEYQLPPDWEACSRAEGVQSSAGVLHSVSAAAVEARSESTPRSKKGFRNDGKDAAGKARCGGHLRRPRAMHLCGPQQKEIEGEIRNHESKQQPLAWCPLPLGSLSFLNLECSRASSEP